MCVVCTYLELSLNVIPNIYERMYLGFVRFYTKKQQQRTSV